MEGVRVRVSREVSPLIREVLYAGLYERHELRALARLLRPDDVLVELGTGLGLLAAFAAKRLGSNAVFTFEANPLMAPVILDTFQANDVAPCVEFCALGPEPGVTTLWVEDDFWNSSTVRGSARARPIRVPVRSARAELDRLRPTVLVIDIEGGEVELLPALDLGGLRALVIELHPLITGQEASEAVRARLLRDGFRIFSEEGPTLTVVRS